MSVKRNTPEVLTQRDVPLKFIVLSLFVFDVQYMIEYVWAWAKYFWGSCKQQQSDVKIPV